MPVISQGLTIPTGLQDGQVADASHVIPLYNALNAFNIPSTIGVFQVALADDTLYTLNMASTPTKDFTVTTVPQLKSILYYIPFSWNTLPAASLFVQLRVNGSAVTLASVNFASVVAGNGIAYGFINGHDADMPRSFYCIIMNDTNTNVTVAQPNADLAASSITSIGIAFSGSATGNVKLKHARFWNEG
jgi:hypothetical protein